MNIQASVVQVVNYPHEITVPQLATLFLTVLGQFDDHGRQLAVEIVNQMAGDRDTYGEGLGWLEAIVDDEVKA